MTSSIVVEWRKLLCPTLGYRLVKHKVNRSSTPYDSTRSNINRKTLLLMRFTTTSRSRVDTLEPLYLVSPGDVHVVETLLSPK